MSQQSLQEVAQDVPVDEALVEEIVDAFNVGNVDTIVEYFHEDGVFQIARGPAPSGVRIEGKEAIRKFLTERSAQTPDWYWHPIRNWCVGDKPSPSGRSLEPTLLASDSNGLAVTCFISSRASSR
jgi:hypothetical protein